MRCHPDADDLYGRCGAPGCGRTWEQDAAERCDQERANAAKIVPLPTRAPTPAPARRTVVAHRFRCFVGLPLCDRGTGRPNRAVCRHCGDRIIVETGQWAAFHWALTGEYPLGDAVATFASRALADEAAEERNLVVRFVPDGAQ